MNELVGDNNVAINEGSKDSIEKEDIEKIGDSKVKNYEE